MDDAGAAAEDERQGSLRRRGPRDEESAVQCETGSENHERTKRDERPIVAGPRESHDG